MSWLVDVIAARYASYTAGIGKEIVEGTTDIHKLEQHALAVGEISNVSGRQERIKSVLNQYLLQAVTS